MWEYQNTKMFLKLVIKKVKTTAPWIQVIDFFNNEEKFGTFYEKDLHKTSRVAFRTEKVIKRKCNRLQVKWKRYYNLVSSWINMKHIV